MFLHRRDSQTGSACGDAKTTDRPWGIGHAAKKERHLEPWKEKLGLETLSDLEGTLPRVEAVLREMHEQGKTGQTLRNFADAITCFSGLLKRLAAFADTGIVGKLSTRSVKPCF
jgi:hypothetical protein